MFKIVPMNGRTLIPQEPPVERLRETLSWDVPPDTRGTNDAKATSLVSDAAPGQNTGAEVDGVPTEVKLNIRTAEQRAETAPASRKQPTNGASEIDAQAARCANRISEALVDTMKGIHQMITEDRQGADSVAAVLAEASDEMRRISNEMLALRERAESSAIDEEQLRVNLVSVDQRLCQQEIDSQWAKGELAKALTGMEKIEQQAESRSEVLEALNESLPKWQTDLEQALNRQASVEAEIAAVTAEASELKEHLETVLKDVQTQTEKAESLDALCTALQQGQRSLEERMDAQASAIRTLHASVQGRGNHIDELLSTLHRLEELRGSSTTETPLPEDL